MPQLPRRPRDTIPDSRWKAMTSSAGLLHPDVGHVLDDFAAFTHPAARAAFADKWILRAARRFEATWQVLYQLLTLVDEQQLYAKTEALEDHQTFPSFQAYWEAKTGKSFDQWLELEQTYAYVCQFKPEMIDSLYAQAQKAALAHRNQVAAGARGGLPQSARLRPGRARRRAR